MNSIPYNLDIQTLEIFPSSICNNTRIVFHGTVASYAERIESTGFQRGVSAYDIENGLALVEMLQLPEFAAFDVEQPAMPFIPDWPRTVAASIAGYIKNVQHQGYNLSFAILSSDCLDYTNTHRKGGQGYAAIRRAKEIVDQALVKNPELSSQIPLAVRRLFEELELLKSVAGVVYAVEMPQNLHGLEISDDLNTVWSSQPISASAIIEKVTVPIITDIPPESERQNQRIRKQRRQGMLLDLGRIKYG